MHSSMTNAGRRCGVYGSRRTVSVPLPFQSRKGVGSKGVAKQIGTGRRWEDFEKGSFFASFLRSFFEHHFGSLFLIFTDKVFFIVLGSLLDSILHAFLIISLSKLYKIRVLREISRNVNFGGLECEPIEAQRAFAAKMASSYSIETIQTLTNNNKQ